jgi:hypothetical protein
MILRPLGNTRAAATLRETIIGWQAKRPPYKFKWTMSKTRKKSSTKSRRSRGEGGKRGRRWSAKVTKHSDALDLERSVFKLKDPHKIALSLKRSAQISKRRKGTPYQSAMSMLNFYINRAGKNLPQKQKRVLERAKDELRDVFDRA